MIIWTLDGIFQFFNNFQLLNVYLVSFNNKVKRSILSKISLV